MRGLQSIRTGQGAIAGIEPARAVQRGHVAAPDGRSAGDAGHHARARAAATTFLRLAGDLRLAARSGQSGNSIPVRRTIAPGSTRQLRGL